MKQTRRGRFARMLCTFLAAALLAAALPVGGMTASAASEWSYFVTGQPPFAYVVTGLRPLTPANTVKLYQNENMQSYAAYTGVYNIPETVRNPGELQDYVVTEISGAKGSALGALENVPLQGLTLPGTVTVIGSRAFAGCANLREVTFPTSVLQLADDAFSGVFLQKLTLDVTKETELPYESAYLARERALPVTLPCAVTDLLVRAPLTVTGQVSLPGGAVLSGGRITVDSNASLTLGGQLSGAGVVEVANNGSLTLEMAPAAYSGSIKLSGTASQLVNHTSSPLSVVDASGKAVTVKPGETHTGGQKQETPGDDPSQPNRPQISTNYGGTVTVEQEGKVVVISAFEGYRVEEVTINGLSMGVLTRYEFQEASAQNTVAVTFAKGEDPAGPNPPTIDPIFQFTDVSATASYASSVRFLVSNGVFQGMSKTSFAPDQVVTRGMFFSLLKRAEIYGKDFKLACKEPLLPLDVEEGSWCAEGASWAAGTKLVSLDSGLLHPTAPITREEVALYLYRYTHLRGYGTVLDAGRLYAYNDISSLSAQSRRAVAWAATNGYLTPKNRSVRPGSTITRGEIAVTLARYLKAY